MSDDVFFQLTAAATMDKLADCEPAAAAIDLLDVLIYINNYEE